jgi:ABC-type phosphate transport system auxiliary subunit
MGEDNQYNGWNEWAKYVLKSIERLECNISRLEVKTNSDRDQLMIELSKIREETINLREELATLNTSFKIKSSVWGAASGLIAVISLYLMQLLTRSIGN